MAKTITCLYLKNLVSYCLLADGTEVEVKWIEKDYPYKECWKPGIKRGVVSGKPIVEFMNGGSVVITKKDSIRQRL